MNWKAVIYCFKFDGCILEFTALKKVPIDKERRCSFETKLLWNIQLENAN